MAGFNEKNRRNRKILVTGGSGFIGTNLVTMLQDDKFIFVNLDKEKAHQKSKAGTILVDLLENSEIIKRIDFDYIIHLAALSNPAECEKNEKLAIKENVEITKNLLKAVYRKKIKKFIFASTYLVCKRIGIVNEESGLEETPCLYERTKIEAEQVCKNFIEKGMPVIIARFGNVYGPYQKSSYLIPQVINEALKEGKITVKNEKPIRDFIYVGDVISALDKSFDSDYTGILNITSGKGTSVKDLILKIAELTGIPDRKINWLGQGKYEKIVGDNSRAKQVLSWRPLTSLEDGLKKTIEFYKNLV